MKINNKFRSLDDVAKICLNFKENNKKIVLCHGVFDLLHVGHIKHIEEAKKNGDVLIVSLTKDIFIKKGLNRPYFKLEERISSIAALELVDFVIESPNKTSLEVIRKIKPHYYVKGQDYKKISLDKTMEIKNEIKMVESVKGKVIFTNSPMNSSSKLLFDNDMIFSSLQKKSLLKASKDLKLNDLEDILKKINKLKVLVIGETIIDKYIFCETVGKASKEPMLVLRKNFSEIFLGGAASIAQNIAKLSKNVDFLTEMGPENNYKIFINQKLKNIKKFIYRKKNTIEKTRYVDEISNSKIIGVYNVEEENINRNKINTILKKKLKKYDLIVISDYGHGLIDKTTSKIILKEAKKIFVNCQINSNNRGNHTILKYKGARHLIINESELRYEMRDNKTETKNLVRNFSKQYKIDKVFVTQGTQGTLFYDKKSNKYLNVPAIANKIVDKVGTGDVMLAIISLFSSVTSNHNYGLLAGSMFAAKSIEKYGNEDVVNLSELSKFFGSFLK